MKRMQTILCVALIGSALFVGGCNQTENGESNSSAKTSVTVTFMQSRTDVLEVKEIDKGETLTSFPVPTTKVEETEFIGYDLSWVDSAGKDVSFENITSDITVYAKWTKYEKEHYAQYADVAPMIDGMIDEVWNNASQFTVENEWSPDNYKQTKGYVKVMWQEDGLYFLGVMEDPLVVDKDNCSLWVCETATFMSADYSKNPADGQYAAIIGSNGTETYYTGILEIPNVECATQLMDNGWILEVFVPRLSAGEFTENSYIGFDCSLDSYSDDGERDSYCNWYGQGYYWSDVSALYGLKLKK